jgi:hypothetical protein
MSTPNFSNFISNFTDLSSIDIVSSVSGQSAIMMNFNGRYFCIGDLLIQFSDTSDKTDGLYSDQSQDEWTVNFPITYDTVPYTVMLTPTSRNNNRVNVTLKDVTKTEFKFQINNNDGWITFVAIGKRPSSLYTA